MQQTVHANAHAHAHADRHANRAGITPTVFRPIFEVTNFLTFSRHARRLIIR